MCTGTACFVKGADDIVAGVAGAYGVPSGQTSADGKLTLKTARCLGSCGLAPVVVLDGTVLGHQDPASTLDQVASALAAEAAGAAGGNG